MIGTFSRLAAVAIVSMSIGVAAASEPQSVTQFDLPTQPLAESLRAVASQTNINIVFDTPLVRPFTGPPLKDKLTLDQALTRLLAGTGLTYEFLSNHTVLLKPSESLSASPPSSDAVAENAVTRLAQADSPADGARVEGNSTSRIDNSVSAREGPETKLEQIIVTAQKHEERLQDVPVSVSVLNTENLGENAQTRFTDYFASVPGLNLSGNANGGGTTYLTIRGLSAGYLQNPVVATVIDDVPTTASSGRAYGAITSPELDPSDLARIEVLKGPQGTLYGTDSLGGLIKYVTVDPSTEQLSGRVEVVGLDIPDGAAGYAVRGVVNIPISEQVAVRVSGFDRHDPGYIDNLITGEKNFNSANVYGGRLAGLWRPSKNFSVKLSGLFQEAHGGVSFFDSNITGQNAFGSHLGLTTLPGTTPYTTQDQLYSATVTWKGAGLEVVSVTGYVVNSWQNWLDFTGLLGSFAYACSQNHDRCTLPPGAPDGVAGARYLSDDSTHKISEEVRIGSSIGSWLDWRLGGFYTHEYAPHYYGNTYETNFNTGAITGLEYGDSDTTQTFHEYALFGDFTVHLTDQLDIGLGGRESWNKQADQAIFTGDAVNVYYSLPPPYVSPLTDASGSAFTYQVTPRFKFSPNLMAYARIATGYRIGGYNANAFSVTNRQLGVPPSFAPDKTTNYELGIKADLLDHRLIFDASAYYIDWKNFQINVNRYFTAPDGEKVLFGFTANAGNAKSEGLELSLEMRPLEGLTITAQGSYDNAVLRNDLPEGSTAYGLAGDRLPYSMPFSGGLTVNQDIRLTSDWMAFLGGSVNYVGERPYEFVNAPSQGAAPALRIEMPAYTQFNLRAGARYDSTLINLFVNNVGNKRGIVGIQPSYALTTPTFPNPGYLATVIQPRTIGVSISKVF